MYVSCVGTLFKYCRGMKQNFHLICFCAQINLRRRQLVVKDEEKSIKTIKANFLMSVSFKQISIDTDSLLGFQEKT